MSPFEEVVESIAQRIEGLGTDAQVALYCSTARALLSSYVAWSRDYGEVAGLSLLEGAIRTAGSGAADSKDPARIELLSQLEAFAPDSHRHSAHFVAAQACWICVDIALRLPGGQFQARDGAWYLLEPIFQSVTEELFGLSDVGSQRQETDEGTALQSEALMSAVTALETTLDYLEAGSMQDHDVVALSRWLAPLNPA